MKTNDEVLRELQEVSTKSLDADSRRAIYSDVPGLYTTTTAEVIPSEDEALAALKTRLAPGWRWRSHLGQLWCHVCEFHAHALEFLDGPEGDLCCKRCARARGAFLVEVIEQPEPVRYVEAALCHEFAHKGNP